MPDTRDDMVQALRGMRVLELGSGSANAMAGMLLAENGAEIIRVEPPDGDPERGRAGHRVWHRGKHSIVLDLHDPSARSRFFELVESSDALIESLRPGVAERLGVAYEQLRERAPHLVYQSLSGFGERGPLRDLPGYEAMLAAASGRMAGQAGFREGPIFTPVPIASYGAGMLSALGVLAALWARRETGRGQRVHTSLLHALSVYDMTLGYGNRTHAPPQPGQVFGVMEVAFMTAPTRDGRYIQICSRQPHLYRNWLKAIGLEALLDDPDLQHMPDLFPSEARMHEVVEAIQAHMRKKTLDQWMELFSANDVGGDPFLEAREYLDHPQARENGRRLELRDPEVGETLQIGPLGAFRETPSRIESPAPRLGEHQHLLEKILSKRTVEPSGEGLDLPARRPLEGLLVIDCGYFYATPFATTLLAEAGARVIKVEPAQGDPGRRNWKASYSKSMVGKQSIVLDLKSAEGREILHGLVKRADVFLHNFRPGTPERLQIDYETLRVLNPRLIYVYGSCFGSRGPWSHKAGFHSSPNAIVGCGVLESGDGNPPRNRTFADPASALATAAVIAVALHGRERTGKGQFLETTMLSSMAWAVSEWSLDYAGKTDRQVDREQRGFHALQRLYPTSRGWLLLDCHREHEWRALCETLELGLADDPRFASAALRAENDAALGASLDAHFSKDSASAWQAKLRAAGVPAIRADGIDHATFMLEDAHCRANGVSVEAAQPGTPRSPRAGPAIQWSECATPIEPAAVLGSHTREILRELGYAETTLDELDEQGVTRAVGHGLPE